MNNTEWDSIRIFLAVVEEGSMSAAAQVLGVSQPTVSRYILALEEKVGVNLFDRSCSGLKVTEVGASLLDSAKATALGAESFARQVNATSEHIDGHVRLAVSEVVAYYFLPEAITAFNRQFPSIEVEILISDQGVNLNKRDADLLVSVEKPEQPDFVVSHLFEGKLGFFAHRDYLEEYGKPDSLQDLHAGFHQIIGDDCNNFYLREAVRIGRPLSKSHFSFRTDSQKMQVELLNARAGVAVTLLAIAEKYPDLVQLFPEAALRPFNWWLICHRDVNVNPRIHNLMTFLSQWFQQNKWRQQQPAEGRKKHLAVM